MVPDGVEGLILEAGGEGSVLGGVPTFRAPGRLGSSWQWGRWSHPEAGPGWGLGQVFCLEAARKLGLSPAPGAAPLRRGGGHRASEGLFLEVARSPLPCSVLRRSGPCQGKGARLRPWKGVRNRIGWACL